MDGRPGHQPPRLQVIQPVTVAEGRGPMGRLDFFPGHTEPNRYNAGMIDVLLLAFSTLATTGEDSLPLDAQSDR